MIYHKIAMVVLLMGWSLSVLADEPPEPPPLPDAQSLPEGADPGADQGADQLEPEVTIREGKDATIEEYRYAGRLYMVKVIPDQGTPYYLVDSDGDGSLDARRRDIDDPTLFFWKVLRW